MVQYAYKGNDDFRGWLNAGSGAKYYSGLPIAKMMYGGRAEDAKAWTNILLGNVGNDGRSGNARYDKAGQYLYNKWTADREEYKYQKQYDQQMALINAMRTPEPRFINYDITGSWNKARQMAEKAVSPVYKQKMTDFINRQKVELGRKKTDAASGKSALDLALNRLMKDTGTERVRTREDATTNIQNINDTLAFNTRQESLNFDQANRALNEQLGEGNMADSGLGRQQVEDAQLARRDQSNEAIRQSSNQVEAQNTLMNRTFADLTTKETRGKQDTTTKKKAIDLDLERFIEDQRYDKDQKGKELELAKQADIAQKSIGLQGQLVDQWLATLSGRGYTAQEIANAASMYK